MLFQKLRIAFSPSKNGPSVNWYMILRTAKDVVEYMNIDADLCKQALLSIPASITKSHLDGSRERILFTMLQVQSVQLKEGEKLNPFAALNKLVGGKLTSMLGIIEREGCVLVQRSGGYCGQKGFFETWNPEVLQEIEQQSCYFPTDVEVMETDLLYIENGERVPVEFERTVDNRVGVNWNNGWDMVDNFKYRTNVDKTKKIRCKLTQLKLQDPQYIAAMISKAKVIACETHLADRTQLDSMMLLFSQLSGKRIMLKTDYIDELKQHTLFADCNAKHDLIFI